MMDCFRTETSFYVDSVLTEAQGCLFLNRPRNTLFMKPFVRVFQSFYFHKYKIENGFVFIQTSVPMYVKFLWFVG